MNYHITKNAKPKPTQIINVNKDTTKSTQPMHHQNQNQTYTFKIKSKHNQTKLDNQCARAADARAATATTSRRN
ncbi:hypothetical protein ACG3RN_21240 [Pseudomonas aeruginosa]